MWKYSGLVVALGLMSGAARGNVRNSPFSVKRVAGTTSVFSAGTSWHIANPNPEDTLRYDDPNTAGSIGIGLTNGGTYQGAIRLTTTELGPYRWNTLIAVSFYHYEVGTHSGRIIIYAGGTPTEPGDTLRTEPFTVTGQGFFRVDLSSPLIIDASQDMWVSVEITQNPFEFPMGVDSGPAVDGKGDWVYSSTVGIPWSELQDFGLNYNWDILAIVETAPPPDHDVAVARISEPSDFYIIGDTVSPTATFINVGTNSETFDAFFAIYDTFMTPVFMDSTQLTLAPGDSTDYTFTEYTLNEPGDFIAMARVVLSGDMNPYNDTTTSPFIVYPGKLDYIVIDRDSTPLSGPFIDRVLSRLGLTGTYTTDSAEVANLSMYKSLWYTAGIYPNNYRIPPDEGAYIETFLQNGGYTYFEGSDLWGHDPFYGGWNILPWTGIVDAEDGVGDLFTIDGISNNLNPNADGNSYYNLGENHWIERLTPGPTMGGTSEAVFRNPSEGYYCGVAHDQGIWKTFSASFEIAGSIPIDTSAPADSLVKWIADFFGLTVGVEETPVASKPSLRLTDARPNPVTNKAVIEFSVPMAMHTNLSIFDETGRLVTTLVNGRVQAGSDRIIWNTKGASSGLYFYNLTVGKKSITKKLIVFH